MNWRLCRWGLSGRTHSGRLTEQLAPRGRARLPHPGWLSRAHCERDRSKLVRNAQRDRSTSEGTGQSGCASPKGTGQNGYGHEKGTGQSGCGTVARSSRTPAMNSLTWDTAAPAPTGAICDAACRWSSGAAGATLLPDRYFRVRPKGIRQFTRNGWQPMRVF